MYEKSNSASVETTLAVDVILYLNAISSRAGLVPFTSTTVFSSEKAMSVINARLAMSSKNENANCFACFGEMVSATRTD